MPKRTKPVSVTELRANLSRVVRRVRSSHEPIVLTERGKPSAVLLSLEAYAALRGNPEREMLRSIRRGQREIAAGRFFTLDQVMADARKVLKRAQK
jgi:prevent-host-death family protein